MVNLETSQEWQRLTSQLLQARPTTTRITTKYNLPNLDSPKYQKPKKRKRDNAAEEKDDAAKVPRATLTLKTFDPESGVVLKFKTDRAAEVGRLIGGLGRVGRYMAALPEKEEADITMEETPITDQAPQETVPAKGPATAPETGSGQQGSSGGKKKKKGKK